jgi:Mrp family chromosome partitioning ATPase
MPHFDETVSVGDIAEVLYQRLIALRKRCADDQSSRRCLVAVAGVPGSGKSTVTAAVARLYHERLGKTLTILPMVCCGVMTKNAASNAPIWID